VAPPSAPPAGQAWTTPDPPGLPRRDLGKDHP
jgi:hypothetical protein